MNPCESQSEGGTRSLWTGSTLPELSLHHVDIDQGMSWLQKICSTAVRSALFMPRMIPHRTTQMPWSKMRHQVNHTLTTKIGAACLGIPLNLISKSAAHCTWWSDPFLSHGTPWLRCLLQRSPHPVVLQHSRRPSTPFKRCCGHTCKKNKTAWSFVNQTRCAHAQWWKTIAKNSRFCSVAKRKTTSIHTQKKVKEKITSIKGLNNTN